MAAGATLIPGDSLEDYAPCTLAGDHCDALFAVSLPGVLPSTSINWLQAQAACTNAGKRLPSNAEWQAAVAGSPQPGPDDGMTDCATDQASRVPTGSRRACVSSDGAFDMVGNLDEWVADWMPRSSASGIWSPSVDTTVDFQCLAGAETTGAPGGLLRGGHFLAGNGAGPLAVNGLQVLSLADGFVHTNIGFRCMR